MRGILSFLPADVEVDFVDAITEIPACTGLSGRGGLPSLSDSGTQINSASNGSSNAQIQYANRPAFQPIDRGDSRHHASRPNATSSGRNISKPPVRLQTVSLCADGYSAGKGMK